MVTVRLRKWIAGVHIKYTAFYIPSVHYPYFWKEKRVLGALTAKQAGLNINHTSLDGGKIRQAFPIEKEREV